MHEDSAVRNRENEGAMLSTAAMCDKMVLAEMSARGVKRPVAEANVSRNAGLAQSTISNFRKGRIADHEKLGARIARAFEDFLISQINQLQNELAIARATRRDVDFVAAEASIRAAKEALGRR